MPGYPVMPGRQGQGAQLGAGCRNTQCWVRGDTEQCWVKAGRQHSHGGDTHIWAGNPLEPGAGCLEGASPRGADVDGEVGRVHGMEMDCPWTLAPTLCQGAFGPTTLSLECPSQAPALS